LLLAATRAPRAVSMSGEMMPTQVSEKPALKSLGEQGINMNLADRARLGKGVGQVLVDTLLGGGRLATGFF
jgi:hypothetical protein